MTVIPPTLSEMRHALGEPPSSDTGEGVPTGIPTFDEMAHAIHLYQTDPDAYLEHYGVKGMKWGITRTKALLGRIGGRKSTPTKDADGEVVGGIRARTRAGAAKLKDMHSGTTLILEDANGASKIMSKQKDGTFKEVYLSADAERVLRTTKKAESELSDAEINTAINRSKKIEEYNKLFNPQPNPNADLEARVNAMKLEIALRDAKLNLNPPKVGMVKKFVSTVSGGYGMYAQANKAMNGTLDKHMKQMIVDLRDAASASSSNSDAKVGGLGFNIPSRQKNSRNTKFTSPSSASRNWNPNPRATPMSGMNMSSGEQKRVDDFIQDITSMGSNDPYNPYSPSPLEIER